MTSQYETGGLTRTFQSIIYPGEGKKVIVTNSILSRGKSRVGLPPPFIATKVGSRKSENPPRLSVVQDSVVVYYYCSLLL